MITWKIYADFGGLPGPRSRGFWPTHPHGIHWETSDLPDLRGPENTSPPAKTEYGELAEGRSALLGADYFRGRGFREGFGPGCSGFTSGIGDGDPRFFECAARERFFFEGYGSQAVFY